MGVVKSLIGSIVGAAVAVGIYYGIKQSTGETYVWFPLIIGLIVGITTRIASGSSLTGGTRVVAGALAAIVAGCAMFGPDVVESMGKTEFGPIQSSSDRLVNATIAKSDVDDENDSDDQGTADTSDPDDDTASDDQTGSDQPDEGEESSDDSEGQDDASADDQSDDESGDDADSESTNATARNADVNQAFAERGKPDRDIPESPETIRKFEELIKKQKHESWLSTFLPIILSGVGMVLAYVIAQSGTAPGQSGAARAAEKS